MGMNATSVVGKTYMKRLLNNQIYKQHTGKMSKLSAPVDGVTLLEVKRTWPASPVPFSNCGSSSSRKFTMELGISI